MSAPKASPSGQCHRGCSDDGQSHSTEDDDGCPDLKKRVRMETPLGWGIPISREEGIYHQNHAYVCSEDYYMEPRKSLLLMIA